MSVRAAEPSPRELGARSSEAVDSGERLSWLLAVCCVAQFLVILDLSIVNVALPSIQSSLRFSSVDLQWVVDAYAIMFAGFLMLGGRTTDRFGARWTLVAALFGFALASLVGGLAPDRHVLIGARALQGLSGAFMAAGSLTAITCAFPQGPARHRAIGLWGAMNGAGGAAGTFFGGLITQELGWRWILLINPPIAFAAAVGAYGVVSGRRSAERQGRFDLAGALTLTGGLVVLVYGIVTAGYLGWATTSALEPIVAGLALLGLFVLIEARFASAPLVPLKALTGPLRAANGIVLLFSAALFPMWYLSSLYLQQVLGLSPLDTGLVFLPMALTIMLAAKRSGKLVSRFGTRSVLTAGLVMMTCGLLLFGRIGPSGSAVGFVVLPGLLVALGIALSVVSSTITATQGSRPEQAGIAAGLVNTSRQMGGAIGIALLVTVASQRTSTLIGENHGVSDALTQGFRLAYLIAAGFCALAAVAAATLLPRAADPRPSRTLLRFPVAVIGVLACFAVIDFAAAGGAGAPLASGYVMLANFYDLTAGPIAGQSGPLILDDRLQPVWFRPLPTDVVASNLSVQTYEGKPALAWWQGAITSTGATESGEDVLVDQHYRTVATLTGAGGWVLTLHAFQVQGDVAWVTANKNIPMNLTKYGGAKNGAVVDSAVQKYDLRSGRLIYSWDALDHIPLSDSHTPPPPNGFPWDAYHVNSVDPQRDGTFLVSMRDTWAAYLVNAATGKIGWTLGGKHSSFRVAKGAAFEWQHDVVLQPKSEVTLFDDACCQITGAGTYLDPEGPSRGLVVRLDRADRTVTLVRQYVHGSDFDAAYMGSLQVLPNGNVFVGWGAKPYFSEYTKDGSLLLDAALPGPDLSYRATLEPWVGLPLDRPRAAVRRTGGATTVYASWNGATTVAAWRVLAGPDRSHLRAVALDARSGFETALRIAGSNAVFEVQALDAVGRALAISSPVRATP